MPRWKIGAVALLLLAVGGGTLLFVPGDESQVWAYGSLRVGIAFVTLWLAWDDLQKLPWWLLGSLLATVVVIAGRPRLILPFLAGLVIYLLLRRFGGISSNRSPRRR